MTMFGNCCFFVGVDVGVGVSVNVGVGVDVGVGVGDTVGVGVGVGVAVALSSLSYLQSFSDNFFFIACGNHGICSKFLS